MTFSSFIPPIYPPPPTQRFFYMHMVAKLTLFPTGGMAVGVPGEVKGLYEVHRRFGKVPWRDVVIPTVKLCEDGVPLTSALHIALGRLQTQEQKNQFL